VRRTGLVSRGGARPILIVTAFAVATLLLTIPIALNLKRLLPSDTGDTLLSAWLIAWDSERLRHGLRGFFDAPIFFPYRGTLAFSETELGIAVLVAPLFWLTSDPILTYNIAWLLSFVIAGVGMYLLTRELTGSRAAAFAGGMCFALGPFRMTQISHIQMMATGWVPLALFGLHRYFSTRRPRWLVLFAVAWVLQTLSNTYVGYFIGVPVVIVVADSLWRARGDRVRLLIALAIAGAGVAALLAPVGAAYYRARASYHHVRPTDEIVANSADLRSYLVGKRSIGVWGWLPTAVIIDPERELFPGLFSVMLAAIGLIAAASDPRGRRWVIVYGLVAVSAIVLSLGPTMHVWGTIVTTHGPYAWLVAVVPGMDGMRVPARFAIIVMAAVAVFFAFGVAWWLDRVTPRWRPLVLVACVAMVAADAWSVPVQTAPYTARGRAQDRAVAFWLAGRPPGAILHLPIKPEGTAVLDYQFVTLVHKRPIVNGYSGYTTPLVDLLGSGASPLNDADRFPATVRMLRSLGIRYVVVHPGDYDGASIADNVSGRAIARLGASGQIVDSAQLLTATAFELQGWDARPDVAERTTAIGAREMTVTASESLDRIANLTDGDPDTRWFAGLGGQDGSAWLRVDLAQPTDVAQVDLMQAERSLGDYPRQLRIEGVDRAGRSHVLYDAPPYVELGAALVRDASYPTVSVRLPRNESVTLWIRQTAPTRSAWSVHELRLLRR
jgi:F5/8 type C domain